MAVEIFYDGACPVCDRYVRWLHICQSFGDVRLVDVRQHPDSLRGTSVEPSDIDNGMAVNIDGQWYVGDAAANILATISSPSTWFNRINRAIFSNPAVARCVYPLLRAGRNFLLLLMGRRRLTSESAAAVAPFILFNTTWGLFAALHSISYAFFFNATFLPSTLFIGALGTLLIVRPHDARVFLLLLAAFVVDASLQPPLGSNHTIIKNFFLIAVLAGGAWTWLRGGGWSDFFQSFAPAGRALLLLMYVFGVFHKINRDFLDPTVSCAVALWRTMPAPLSWMDNSAMHTLAIYGTFAVETLIFALLLTRRTRTLGIAFGIAFHSMLGLSSYAMYPQFSTLTVALHTLFIDPKSASAILSSPIWTRVTQALRSPLGSAGLLMWIALLSLLAWNGSYSQLAIAWLPSMMVFAWACLAGDKGSEPSPVTRNIVLSKNVVVNLVSALFLVNCLAPYLGLKTAQSINMFANLRLEGGTSNHLILSTPPGPFRYLEDVVHIHDSSGSDLLVYIRHSNLQMTWYGLLDHLERNQSAQVTFDLDGQVYEGQSASTLKEAIDDVLHDRWIRSWFHFNPVDLTTPKPCALDR